MISWIAQSWESKGLVMSWRSTCRPGTQGVSKEVWTYTQWKQPARGEVILHYQRDKKGIMNDEDTNVRVAVRCRPLNDREKNMPDMAKCIDMANGQIVITGPTGEEHSFGFDHMFGENSTQIEVWDSLGAPILDKAFQGYNGNTAYINAPCIPKSNTGTIFAYGQTGSGKTWSMQGADGDLKGVIPRMNEVLFDRITTQRAATPTLQFLVTVSYFELYNEVIFVS